MPIDRMSRDSAAASLLVMARRDPALLAQLNVQIWLGEHAPPPAWAFWLAQVQQVTRGVAQLGFWVGGEAAPDSYIVDFDTRAEPPGFRGIWRVLSEAPVAVCDDGAILLARRVQRIEGRRLGSNQAWRRAAGAARWSAGGTGRWDLQTFAEQFLERRPALR
jgi:hypothetical protein